jgi:hypothetical protein
VIARLSRRVVVMVMILMAILMMVVVRVVVMVMVTVMIARAMVIASRDNGDRGIMLPATPNAAKLAR